MPHYSTQNPHHGAIDALGGPFEGPAALPAVLPKTAAASFPTWHPSTSSPSFTAPPLPPSLHGRGHGAFPDQLPLEHEAAGRGRGVDLARPLAGEHPQAHAAGRQVLHGVDEMARFRPRRSSFQTTSTSPFRRARRQTVKTRPVVGDAGGEVVVGG